MSPAHLTKRMCVHLGLTEPGWGPQGSMNEGRPCREESHRHSQKLLSTGGSSSISLPCKHVWLSCSVVSDSFQPLDCSPPSSSVHRILQARTLEWVAIPFSRGSSRPRDRTHVSMSPALVGGFFITSATWEAPFSLTLTFSLGEKSQPYFHRSTQIVQDNLPYLNSTRRCFNYICKILPQQQLGKCWIG